MDNLIDRLPPSLTDSGSGVAFGQQGEVSLDDGWREVATTAAREIARGDRVAGIAARQAEVVHKGVVYGLEVDTIHTEYLDCARTIAKRAS